MLISKRLQTLANLVTPNHVLADVGCDHGYIPIYLIQNHRIPKAIAMDIGEGPLKRARANIEAFGLAGYIETRLSDGLEKLAVGEVNTILISGMGGPLMEQILTNGRNVLEDVSELILQPQSDVPHFRHFLSESGYKIIQEDMVEEDGKFYPMMKVVKGISQYTVLEERYGPRLLQERHPVLKVFIQRELRKMDEIVENLNNQTGESAKRRLQELAEEQQFPQEALKVYDL